MTSSHGLQFNQKKREMREKGREIETEKQRMRSLAFKP